MTTKREGSPKERKGKWRLSNLLHPKESERGPNMEADTNIQPATANPEATNCDSAYGSSAPHSSIPSISDSQARAQDADIQTSTDEATGKTITTTTTTTTTTVTTTTGDHYQVPPGQQVIVKQGNQNEGPVELSARPVSQGSSSAATNNISLRQQGGQPYSQRENRPRSASPHAAPPVIGADGLLPREGSVSPQDQQLPGPTQRHNFSYPSRTPPGSQSRLPQTNPNNSQPTRLTKVTGIEQSSQTSNPPAPYEGYYGPPHGTSEKFHPPKQPGYGYGAHSPSVGHPDLLRPGTTPDRPSTVQSLKTAAAGIHGAGETLRGTLNSAVARKTGAPNEVVAAHDAVAAKGRQEIETGRFYKAQPSSNPYRNPPGRPTQAAVEPQHGDTAHTRLHPAPRNTQRYSAENSANGVLSQVDGAPAANPYYRGSAAVGEHAQGHAATAAKKKGGLRNVLRKSREGLKT